MSTLLSVDAELRNEADRLLDSGLRELLETFGDVHLTGSYALELMTWRDLDIHVVREFLDRISFFELGGRIAELLEPQRMHFRDETVGPTAGLPRGLYWGIYLGDERKGAWKIDVWATSRGDFEPSKRFCDRIKERLTPETREAILVIKSACWQHPEYRRRFASADIYNAVLDRGIRTAEDFWAQIRSKIS